MNTSKPLEVTQSGNNLKGQYWTFTIYPDEDPEHKKLFEVLTNHYYIHCRWILHDKDKHHYTENEDGTIKYYEGEPKKKHYQFLWHSHNTIHIDQVSALLHLPTHAIEKVNSIAVQIEYLLHRDLKSLFDDYQYKYPTYALEGALDINPNKWDETYLFEHWSHFIRHTNYNWGVVVDNICIAGHFKWLNKYRRLLKDIYDGHHYREPSELDKYFDERSK